jgi:DNA end-binding protein Ku
MAGATIWKGNIHFGDTDVPVKLHSAVREDRIRFHLIHARDQMRLRQQMVCEFDKQPVPAEEQSKGFEVAEGKYIMIDPEEFEQTVPEISRMIEVHEFVNSAQIAPLFVERVYYLEPDSATIKGNGYRALVKILQEMDVEGICTWSMRKRSYVGALQASGKTLRLNTLRYNDEIVPAASLGLQNTALSEKELKIGSELIKQLTEPFEPQKFENEHQKKLQDMIEKKARGEKIAVLAPRRLQPTESDNLLQALEASLKKAA